MTRESAPYHQPESEPQHPLTLRNLGADFQEEANLTLLDAPIRPIAHTDSLTLAYVDTVLSPEQFYSLLTAIKPHQDSQGTVGTLNDWENPEFPVAHANLVRSPLWNQLLTNLRPLIDTVSLAPVPEDKEFGFSPNKQHFFLRNLYAGSAYLQPHGEQYFPHAADHVYKQALQGTAGYSKYFNDQNYFKRVNAAFLSFVHDHGFEEITALLPTAQHDTRIRTDAMEIAKKGASRIHATRQDLYMLHDKLIDRSDIRHQRIKHTHRQLVHRYVESLGATPADRAMRLVQIGLGEWNPYYDRKYNYDNPTPDQVKSSQRIYPQITVKKTAPDLITVIGNHSWNDPEQIYLASPANRAFYAPDEEPPVRGLVPVIGFQETGHGRQIIIDHEEIKHKFGDILTSLPLPKQAIPSAIVGALVSLYAQPALRARMRPEKKFHHSDQTVYSNAAQAIQEAQVPLAALMMEHPLLNNDLINNLRLTLTSAT